MRFFKLPIILLAAGLLVTACTDTATKTTHHPLTAPLYQMIDAEFDAAAAYKTVGFVEQFWRIAGNEGFDKSIRYVEDILKNSGFVEESSAGESDRLTYRVEHRAMQRPTWEPVSASLKFADGEEILNSETNRNMITINSYPTSGPQEFNVVYVETDNGVPLFAENVAGKVVFAEGAVGFLFNEAVVKRGAAGVIAYRMPAYLQPEKNQQSIQFSRIPLDEEQKSWGILLSYKARESLINALTEGRDKIVVDIDTKIYPSEELTLVAELKGSKLPDERLVFSAHVQEPGANDNASGVGVLAEVASSSARLLKAGRIDPERTITYLFGDEIVSTNRFILDDAERALKIKWGISLDMVGEDTEKTGGTFLIEKMPDPAAIWTRGEEKHSEWGGRPLSKEDMKPHYLNDFILNRFLEQGAAKNWVVKVNPFEGGSDHTPFLRNDIPGLLLWHFTDQFYHTDFDRLDKVSPVTLKNVGTGALVSALVLTGNEQRTFNLIVDETTQAGLNRLRTERDLSKKALQGDGNLDYETDILLTWADWYIKALKKADDMLSSPNSKSKAAIDKSVALIHNELNDILETLGEP